MDIEIDGTRALIQPGWKQRDVQTSLLKSCLSLTRIHPSAGQELSSTESLATCLIQHLSGRYSGINNLNDVWKCKAIIGDKCTEEEWIRFRLQLERNYQHQWIGDIHSIIDYVIDVFIEFNWFQLGSKSTEIVCLVNSERVIIRNQDDTNLTNFTTHYVWHDRDNCLFYGIAKWGETFQDKQAYQIALTCQLAPSLKDFYCLQFRKNNPNDDDLETWSSSYLDELNKKPNRSIEDHLKLLASWDSNVEVGPKLILNELLNPSFVSKRKEIEKELRQEFIESLEMATEELQIEHREAYEKTRLQAVEDRKEEERRERRTKIEIKAAEVEVDKLQRKLDERISAANEQLSSEGRAKLKKALSRDRWRSAKFQIDQQNKALGLDENAGIFDWGLLIQQQKEFLKEKKEKLEWDRFYHLLDGSNPPYELAKLNHGHKFFKDHHYTSAVELVEDVFKEFSFAEPFRKENGNMLNLLSYVKQNSSTVIVQIQSILEKMIKEPTQNKTGQVWNFDGKTLLLSWVVAQTSLKGTFKCEEIIITASRIIYIDCVWNTPGISVGLSAPYIEATGSQNLVINTSGLDAPATKPEKAKDGVGEGLSGDNGVHGEPGQSAGHVIIICDTFHGQSLHIKARGGSGADGQHGGNGKPGRDGENGTDGELLPPKEVEQDFTSIPLQPLKLIPIWGAYELARSAVNSYYGSKFNTKHLVQGTNGTPGKAGGSGGTGGYGGQGGQRGEVNIQVYKLGKHLIHPIEDQNGCDGKDGQPGEGAKGGMGGRNGLDAARVFEPDDLNPWFSVSGNWKEAKGHLVIQPVLRTSDKYEIGSKIIVKDSDDKGRSTDGQHGEDGEKSERSERKTSVPKRTMANVGADWKSDASMDSAFVALQSAEAAVEKLDKLMAVSDENQRRLKASAEKQEESEKKLKKAKEMEQRLKRRFEQAKNQQSTTQSQSLQRTHTIADDRSMNIEPIKVTSQKKPIAATSNSDAISIQIGVTENSIEWDTLKDASLLDALIAKYNENTEVSQALSLMTQSLVLQIYLDDMSDRQKLWIWLTNIIRRYVDSTENVIDCLKLICQDIDLVQAIIDSGEFQMLENLNQTILQKTSALVDVTNPVSTIYHFRRLAWTYEELQNLMIPLENYVGGEKTNGKTQFQKFMDDQLVFAVVEKMISHFEEDVKKVNLMMPSQIKLLTELIQCLRRNSSKPLSISLFFDELVNKLQPGSMLYRNKKKTANQVESILNEFIRHKLNVSDNLSKLLPPYNETQITSMTTDQLKQVEKLIFIVDRTRIEAKELDEIRSIIEKEKLVNKEPYKSVHLATERAFDKFYWNSEWNEIQDLLVWYKKKIQEPVSKDKSSNTLSDNAVLMAMDQWGSFQECVFRLKAALMWQQSRKSCQEKLALSRDFKKKLKMHSGWGDTFSSVVNKAKQVPSSENISEHFFKTFEWVRGQELDIIGSFNDDRKQTSDKESFRVFLHQLTTALTTKFDAKLMKPQLRRALYYLHQNKQEPLTAYEMDFLNKLVDKSKLGIIKDDSFYRNQLDLRQEHVLHWPNRYFLRWTDYYEEIDTVRLEVRKKWRDVCIYGGSNTVAEPKKAAQRMDILLNRYALLTTFFLSPIECAKKWQSLKTKTQPESLEKEIKRRGKQDFPQIRSLIADVETVVAEKLGIVQAEPSENLQSSADCPELERCLAAINSLLKSNFLIDNRDEVVSCLSSLLLDLELLIGLIVDMDDSNPMRVSNMSSQLEEWRALLMDVGENIPTESICKSISKILDIVSWSISNDLSIVEEFTGKIKCYRQDMERAMRSHETFVGHMADGLLCDELDIIKATVKVFKDGEDFCPWSLGCHKNPYQLLLVAKQIDIWIDCLPNNKEIHPSYSRDPLTFLKVLLAPSSATTLKARLAIASELLCDHLDTPKNFNELEHWCSLLEQFDNVKLDEETTKQLTAVQTALISHFSIFRVNQLHCHTEQNRQSIKFNSMEIVNHLTTVSRFLGNPEKMNANRLLLLGLLRLAKELDHCSREQKRLYASNFMVGYLQHLFQLFDEKNIKDVKRKSILEVLYSVVDETKVSVKLTEEEKQNFFTIHEKAYIERWIQTESCCADNKSVGALYNKILEIYKIGLISSQNSVNRLVSSAGFSLLFTAIEKKYLTIVGENVAEEVFKTKQPTAFLSTLKERAVHQIYRNLIRYFYPEPDAALDDLFQTYRPNKYHQQLMSDDENNFANDKRKCVVAFQRAFDRAYFFAEQRNLDFEWLIWLQETVLKSLVSISNDQVQLNTVTELITATAELTTEELFLSTATSRPQQWVDGFLVSSIMKAISQLPASQQPSKESDAGQLKHQRWTITTDLQMCLKSGRELLNVFLQKLKREARLVAATEAIDFKFVAKLVGDLKDLRKIDYVERFRDSSIRQWPRVIRLAKLAEVWPPGLADQITAILDRRLGPQNTDRFLERFKLKFRGQNSQEQQILENMLRNLSKYPWIIDQFFKLALEDGTAESESENKIWQLVQSKNLIEEDRIEASKSNLEVKELLKMMKNDPESQAIVGGIELQEKLIEQVEVIKSSALNAPRNQWNFYQIHSWTHETKTSKKRLDPVDFLSVAYQAVNLTKGHGLRDAQMLAVLIFVSSTRDNKVGRRMAQISTGEGKTLITALLVVYHVLSNWSIGRRLVDIITSSSVLAEANVTEMKWFYELFGVGVENNCDEACSKDEKLRSKRYNTDVIYGDLSSFQRDILLSRFFSDRDITRNREAGAIVVDEVDSMLLDKGENILYLSHKIPEMDDLLHVFVEIWNAVHAPEALKGDESAQAMVYEFTKTRIDRGEIAIPKCLESFVRRHLLVWTRNAFRAKYVVTTKDSYKVDDIGDGRGQQVVIMDKETGVEQAQMQWSNGLHQFLQLKHALKLSPVSLKAVFMSNIGFFEQRKDAALYGMTGTLGSTAECQLLHEVFQVDFFKMPRFRRRFCLEEDHLLAANSQEWLNKVYEATKTQLDKERAVLVVCENIKAAESVHSKLSTSFKDRENCKIVQYISSFDTEFQKKQHETALISGDIIVATNLAGRGTDLKISDELAQCGGLHVIIGYMPANARVEAQIEGRVARAGQPGSFQFVICHPSVNQKESDAISELSRLKVLRDDQECRRLEIIRTQGLQRIFLEEKLFDRFHKEIYEHAKNTLETKLRDDRDCRRKEKSSFVETIQDQSIDKALGKNSNTAECELQMTFLTNRWALWLDESSDHIDNIHLKKTDVVEKNFEQFKKDCLVLLTHNVGSTSNEAVRFASTPSELLKLGEFLEKSNKSYDIAKSHQCYDQVVKDEPNACDVALIRKAKLILQDACNDKKKEAKLLLVRAKELIHEKMERLSSAKDLIKKTTLTNKQVSENRFEEQIVNFSSLLQIHLTALEDILGRPMSSSLTMQFPKEEEAQDLIAAINNLEDQKLCKSFRISTKASIVKAVDEDDDAIWIDYENEDNKRMIEWPSPLLHCRNQTVALIKKKLKTSSRLLKKGDLKEAIVTQDKLWDALIKSGLIGKENIIDKVVIRWAEDQQIESDSHVEIFLSDLPDTLAKYKTVLVGWLQEHDGEEFLTAVSHLGLNQEQISTMKEFLVTKKILVEVNERKGNLLKTLTFQFNQKSNTSSVIGLPIELKEHEHLLSTWILLANNNSADSIPETVVKQERDPVSRESLPCPKDEGESLEQLWSYLISQGVIKDRKIVFSPGLAATKEEIGDRFNEIKLDITSLSAIEEIYWKHNPPPEAVTEASYTDYLSYWSYKVGSNIPLSDVEKMSIKNEDICKWLTACKNKELLETYRSQVVSALTNSLGQLKTIPVVSASFQPLNSYFMSAKSGAYPAEEIQSFNDKTFNGVIKLNASKSLWDYWDRRVFYVGLIAMAQIGIGVSLTALSGGALGLLGGALISEGVSDLTFAVQSSLSGNFSWASYKSHKKSSLAMTICTVGLGAYLTKGAAAGKLAVYGLKTKGAWPLFMAAGKQALAKCGKAILSTLSNMGAEKLLSWLKKFIIEKILVHIKWLIRKILSPLFNRLSEALGKLWTLMKQKGYQVGHAIGLIDANISKASSSELGTLWGRRMAGQAASVGSAIGRCFSESRDILSADGQDTLLNKENEEGFDVLKKSFRFVRYADKAMKIVQYLKNGSEIVGLVSYAPEYVINVEKTLAKEVKKLEAEEEEERIERTKEDVVNKGEEDDESTKETVTKLVHDDQTDEMAKPQTGAMYHVVSQSVDSEFSKYKEEVAERVENDITKYMVDSVTSTWVQPWLQSKIENLVMYAGSKTLDGITSLWQGSSNSSETQKKESGSTNEENSTAEDAAKKKEEAEAKKGEMNDLLGADGCEVHTDSDGNIVVKPKSYKNLVDNLGEGRAAGLLEMQMVADACGLEIEIVNYGEEGKNFSVGPDGKSSGKIQVIYTKNEDGTNHVSLMGPDGKAMELPSSVEGAPSAANRCLYEAVAQARQCSVDQLLNEVKTHAHNNKQAQYLYNERVDEALSDRRVGRDTREGSRRADLYFIKDNFGGIRNVVATITAENLQGGSNSNKSTKEEIGSAKQTNDELGHLLAWVFGGAGGKKLKNIVAMDKDVNHGCYKDAETKLLKYMNETPNARVYVNIRLNEGIAGFVDPRRPVNFRFNWCGVERRDNGDNIATYCKSNLFQNTQEFGAAYRGLSREQKDAHFQLQQAPLENMRVEEPVLVVQEDNRRVARPLVVADDSEDEVEVVNSRHYKYPPPRRAQGRQN